MTMKTILITLLAAALAAHAQQSTLGEGNSYAWSGNFGWVEMTPNRPNPGDGFRFGEFACAGWIWSANTGWINHGPGILKTDSMAITDSDKDGISDAFEITFANGDLGVMDATSDQDGDGFSDKAEYLALTNPLSAQSFLKVTKIETVAPHNGTATELTWISSPARCYMIEGSNDLGQTQPWAVSPSDPQSFSADAGSSTTRTSNHAASDKRFFRVYPLVPLQP